MKKLGCFLFKLISLKLFAIVNLQVMIVSPRTTIAARLQLIVGMSPGIIEHRAPVRKELISIFNFVAMAMLMKVFCQRDLNHTALVI